MIKTFSFLICCFSLCIANVGGTFTYPASISGPLNVKHVPVCIDSEHIQFEIIKTTFGAKCKFTAEYFFSNNTDSAINISGLFYGERIKKTKVIYKGNVVSHEFKQPEVMKYDSIFFINRVEENAKQLYEYRKEDLLKKGYKIQLVSGNSKLIVEGELKPKKDFAWGLQRYTVMDYHKHPFFTSADFSIYYLIEPIKTWKCVGPIKVTIAGSKSIELVLYTASEINAHFLFRTLVLQALD